MEIVLGTASLPSGRGADGYLLTLGRELLRLGHVVTVFVTAHAVDTARTGDAGLRVVGAEDAEGTRCEAAVALDGASAYALARRYPQAAQLFVAHTEPADAELPPQLGGVVRTAVALSERAATRLRGLARAPRIVRLREPAGLDLAVLERPLHKLPRRLLALVGEEQLRLLEGVAAERGIEVEVAESTAGRDYSRSVGEADVVVGSGRVIVDAMAAGCAAYVWGRGGGCWVTPETYEAMEADGFSGRTLATALDRARLSAALDAYTPALGASARALAVAYHAPAEHAEAIIGLLREADALESMPALLGEVERLTQLLWSAETRERALVRELERLRAALLDAERAAPDGRRVRRLAANALARARGR